jgi:hypothetical protein
MAKEWPKFVGGKRTDFGTITQSSVCVCLLSVYYSHRCICCTRHDHFTGQTSIATLCRHTSSQTSALS